MDVATVRKTLWTTKDPEKAKFLQGFFKTHKGQYGWMLREVGKRDLKKLDDYLVAN